MDDVAVVRVRQRIGDFAQNAPHFHRRYRTVLLEALAEVVALDIRHDEVNEIVFLFDGVDRNDIRVIELRGSLRLAQESLADVGAETQLRRQDLDRDLALETPVPGAVHDTHTAATDLAL